MTTTKPASEQIRFVSAKTGEHNLDTYLEAVEQGSRTLGDMIEDLFEPSQGALRQNIFNFRVNAGHLQSATGDFVDLSSAPWQNVAPFMRDRGTFTSSATYENLDIVTSTGGTTYLVTSSDPITFANEAAFLAEAYPTLPNAEPYQSGYATRADFVTAVAGGITPPDNSIVFANGLAYIKTNNSSNLTGLTDYEPYGPIYPDHFADNTTPGTTDMRTAIQAAIEHVKGTQPYGGGTVNFRKDIYATSGPITVYSDISLQGEGLTLTYIRALNSATFAANEAVIQSENFPTVQGTDVWEYSSPYPAGLCMGFQIDGLTIDANRANVANAGGLHIFGGKWVFGTIGVINTAGHGIWTECGTVTDPIAGDDHHDFLNLHESKAENIYISNTDQHGWLFRGPGFGKIENIQVQSPNHAGFYQENTATNASGALRIDSLYVARAQCAHSADGGAIHLTSASVNSLRSSRSEKHGFVIEEGVSIISSAVVVDSNVSNAGTFYGANLQYAGVIDFFRFIETTGRTSGTNGGAVLIDSTGTSIGQARIIRSVSSTISNETGIRVNAQCHIGFAQLSNYSDTGCSGIELSAQDCTISLYATNCTTGLSFNTAGRNDITVRGKSNTTDIDYVVASSATDQVALTSNSVTRAHRELGNIRAHSDVTPTLSLKTDTDSSSFGRVTFEDSAGNPVGRVAYSFEFDYMAFETNQSEAMRITSAGDVGIGATDVSIRLLVSEDEDSGTAAIRNVNASFTKEVLQVQADRAANSAFDLLVAKTSVLSSSDTKFKVRGDGQVTADGSFTGGGADYAEYFEWEDGNPSNEDRRGWSVTLSGDKIRPAQTGEDPIGVVSANPSVVGDSDIGQWKGKYLKDDFGQTIFEDYEVAETGETLQRPKLNPAYDPSQEYVSREDRQEWDTVGLTGKLRLRKGQPTSPRWIKMRDVNIRTEEWLVR